ncbi:MAG: hypothetical protein JXL80_04300 [Planctomycetes bacterium]|nr:hypothetical protein [Planctomycetota bacterium]
MGRKIVVAGVAAVMLVVAFLAGWFVGSSAAEDAATRRQAQRDLELYKELVKLNQSFLAGVEARPSTLTPGTYVLETHLVGQADPSSVLVDYANGQLVKQEGLPVTDFTRQGSMVSWSKPYTDPDQGPQVSYVGLIDGDTMWGRVYVAPGQGWHEDEPPNYGVWRLVPQDE